jgi:hypothetical protein
MVNYFRRAVLREIPLRVRTAGRAGKLEDGRSIVIRPAHTVVSDDLPAPAPRHRMLPCGERQDDGRRCRRRRRLA